MEIIPFYVLLKIFHFVIFQHLVAKSQKCNVLKLSPFLKIRYIIYLGKEISEQKKRASACTFREKEEKRFEKKLHLKVKTFMPSVLKKKNEGKFFCFS